MSLRMRSPPLSTPPALRWPGVTSRHGASSRLDRRLLHLLLVLLCALPVDGARCSSRRRSPSPPLGPPPVPRRIWATAGAASPWRTAVLPPSAASAVCSASPVRPWVRADLGFPSSPLSSYSPPQRPLGLHTCRSAPAPIQRRGQHRAQPGRPVSLPAGGGWTKPTAGVLASTALGVPPPLLHLSENSPPPSPWPSPPPLPPLSPSPSGREVTRAPPPPQLPPPPLLLPSPRPPLAGGVARGGRLLVPPTPPLLSRPALPPSPSPSPPPSLSPPLPSPPPPSPPSPPPPLAGGVARGGVPVTPPPPVSPLPLLVAMLHPRLPSLPALEPRGAEPNSELGRSSRPPLPPPSPPSPPPLRSEMSLTLCCRTAAFHA